MTREDEARLAALITTADFWSAEGGRGEIPDPPHALRVFVRVIPELSRHRDWLLGRHDDGDPAPLSERQLARLRAFVPVAERWADQARQGGRPRAGSRAGHRAVWTAALEQWLRRLLFETDRLTKVVQS
jgi:hypothetical protein